MATRTVKTAVLGLSLSLNPALLPAQQGVNPTQPPTGASSHLRRIEAQPSKGFDYPYYLYVPDAPSGGQGSNVPHTLLVVPNNTGKVDDDPAVHDAAAKRQVADSQWRWSTFAVATLEPVFPRPASDALVYTHALGRASLLTTNPRLHRFDLQLIHMIDDARERLRAEHRPCDERVMMFGFSASGMFTNRFAMLHPDRIKAAAFGSPGGWAMAPLASWKGERLRYPIGTADLEAVAGQPFDLSAVQRVPQFLFMGDEDTNDSVIYRDSYDQEDEDLIFRLFGKTLIDRWPITQAIYKDALPLASLKLYPGVGHSETNEMLADVTTFFRSHMNDSR